MKLFKKKKKIEIEPQKEQMKPIATVKINDLPLSLPTYYLIEGRGKIQSEYGKAYKTAELFLYKPHFEDGKMTSCDFLLLTGKDAGLLFRDVNLETYSKTSCPCINGSRDIFLNEYVLETINIYSSTLANCSTKYFDINYHDDAPIHIYDIRQKYNSCNKNIFNQIKAEKERNTLQNQIWEAIDKQQ